jgi:hypothetical protein
MAEVARLKLLVAELALDRRMLREALKKAVTASRRRVLARKLCEDLNVSQTRVSRALDLARSLHLGNNIVWTPCA